MTLLDAFEGRRLLIAYYFMWHPGHPAPEQCEGCTFFTLQVCELSTPKSFLMVSFIVPPPWASDSGQVTEVERAARAMPRRTAKADPLQASPASPR